MEEITSIHDIDAILEKAADSSYSLDIPYIAKKILIHEGFIIICCPAIKERIEKGLYFLSWENFNKWTENNKNWFTEILDDE